MTGLKWRTWGATQLGSGVLFSAVPTTSPRSFIAKDKPLLPPSVGSGVIAPSCQTNGRHKRPSLKLHRKKFSPSGSEAELSAAPTILPLSFTEEFVNVELFGPPSVPRSLFTPLRHSKAWTVESPGSQDQPVAQPLLLTPRASLTAPPRVPR